MTFDPKSLKKLAKQLRTAGIKSYKCADFEMVLADETPVVSKRPRRKLSPNDTSQPTETDGWDSLTEEQKLYYSVSGEPDTSEVN